jgi:hypothetical protein
MILKQRKEESCKVNKSWILNLNSKGRREQSKKWKEGRKTNTAVFCEHCKTRTNNLTPVRSDDACAAWQPGGGPLSWEIKHCSEWVASLSYRFIYSLGDFPYNRNDARRKYLSSVHVPFHHSRLKFKWVCGTSLALRFDVAGNSIIFLHCVPFFSLLFPPSFLILTSTDSIRFTTPQHTFLDLLYFYSVHGCHLYHVRCTILPGRRKDSLSEFSSRLNRPTA